MKFAVTKGHIMNGAQYDSRQCPIALAIREQFPLACVRVGSILMIDDVSYFAPPNVRRFISRFDACESRQRFRGITFELPTEECQET